MKQRKRPEPGLERALAGAGDGVFAVGPEGQVMLWNRSAEKILGWSAVEVMGRPCCEIFTGLDSHGNRLCYQGCHVMSLVKLGEPVQHFDMQTRTKAGRPVWLNISILEAPGGPAGRSLTIHFFRDVTATKELLRVVSERLQSPAAPPAGAETTLSRRELEVLRLMAGGANTKALAERLHVSSATIRNHAQSIFTKLGVHSRLEAVAYATQHRLV
ncbi:MAG TPA: LuxR C-terminal-related transcriptional regulator [Terriglobales bacterium]|nr:LuxR C-terminal-related transcriptional regulator [Terriglobales bacterium]